MVSDGDDDGVILMMLQTTIPTMPVFCSLDALGGLRVCGNSALVYRMCWIRLVAQNGLSKSSLCGGYKTYLLDSGIKRTYWIRV